MYNLLKAEMFKIKYSKELKICILLIVILGITNVSFHEMESGKHSLTSEGREMIGLLICTLFAGMYIGAEFSQKTIYHPVISGYKRFSVLVSKYISYLVACTIILITNLLMMGGLYSIFYGWGEAFTSTEFQFITTYSIVGLFLDLCLVSISFFIAFQLEDTGISIAVSLVAMGIILLTSQIFWERIAYYIADRTLSLDGIPIMMTFLLVLLPAIVLLISSLFFSRQDMK